MIVLLLLLVYTIYYLGMYLEWAAGGFSIFIHLSTYLHYMLCMYTVVYKFVLSILECWLMIILEYGGFLA